MVLDMRDKAREGILDYDYVEEHAGPFQLFTEQPVGVQKNRPYSTEPIPRGTSGAKSHAAVRGCDLLLLLGDNIPNRSTVRSTWLVHLGKRQR